ncbi:hypothetical protein ACROYT_G015564 [Oculina patagonica]
MHGISQEQHKLFSQGKDNSNKGVQHIPSGATSQGKDNSNRGVQHVPSDTDSSNEIENSSGQESSSSDTVQESSNEDDYNVGHEEKTDESDVGNNEDIYPELSDLSYEQRLDKLKWSTLELSRKFLSLVQVYKIISVYKENPISTRSLFSHTRILCTFSFAINILCKMADEEQPAVQRPRADQGVINAAQAVVPQVEPPAAAEPAPLQ